MQKLYQDEWFGINFNSFSKMDSKCMPDQNFYDKFYAEFYKRFSSYEDLPSEWKKKKAMIADYLACNSTEGMKILSIGCGIGYIEDILKKNRNITAIEPSYNATIFLERSGGVKIYYGYFPQCLEGSAEKFDLIYLVDTDYVFDKKGLIGLLKHAKEYSDTIIIVSIFQKIRFLNKIKNFIKLILTFFNIYERGQFWGYSRIPKDLLSCFMKAGYSAIEHGFLNADSYWVKGQGSRL